MILSTSPTSTSTTATTAPPLLIDGFDYRRLPGDDGIELSVAVGGPIGDTDNGPIGDADSGAAEPVVLLHGFPQTHLMWRAVAVDLARDRPVVVPDLRGYGRSDKPAETDEATYAKRTMANDLVAIMASLGHHRFTLVGHDRGALVAVRAGLDHPEVITRIGILDVLPTMDSWDVLAGVQAKVAWHLYLMAQPADLPERMITAVADDFFASFLDAWDPSGRTFSADVRRHYLDSCCAAVPSIVADYRASAGIDLETDRADRAAGRRLAMPVAVISQDWGSLLGFDPVAIWSGWAADLSYEPIDAGHFMAEEKPAAITDFVRRLLKR